MLHDSFNKFYRIFHFRFGVTIFLFFAAFLFLLLILFLLVYPIPIFIALSCLTGGLFLFSIVFISLRWRKNHRDFWKNIELELFEKRRLFLDSLYELEEKNKDPDTLSKMEEEVVSLPQFKNWKHKQLKNFTFHLILAGIMLFLCAVLWFTISSTLLKKMKDIRFFLSSQNSFSLPDYYVESKPLRLDLSEEKNSFDHLFLQASNTILESSNLIFEIGENFTAAKKLDVSVIIQKYGMDRIVLKKTLNAVKKLFPDQVALKVIYPAETKLSMEEYSGLQDIEAWEGAKIEILCQMTKSLSSISVLTKSKWKSVIDNNHFKIFLTPASSERINIYALSKDKDSYDFPNFFVQVNQNQAPAIKLIFPAKDVVLNYYRWNILSQIVAEDDQGVRKILFHITISNRQPLFRKDSIQIDKELDGGDFKILDKKIIFSYQELDVLPNETASIIFQAVDVFGKKSGMIGFNIISPDFLDIQRERSQEEQKIRKTIQAISNHYQKLSRDLQDRDLAATTQEKSELQKNISDLDQSVSALEKSYSFSGISEIQDNLERMKKIVEELKDKQGLISQLAKMMQNTSGPDLSKKFQSLKTGDILKLMESFLKNLEHYKKSADLINRFKILKNVYEGLKNQTQKQNFDRFSDSFQNEAARFMEKQTEPIRGLAKTLQEESKRFKMADWKSFEPSDTVMEQLEKAVQDEIQDTEEKREKERKEKFQKIFEELYLNALFLDQAFEENPINLTEIVNSSSVSTKMIKIQVEKALENLLFVGNTGDEIQSILNNIDTEFITAQDFLRDNKLPELNVSLREIQGSLSLLFLYLLKVDQAAGEAAQKQNSSGGEKQSAGMNLSDLLKLQSAVTGGLEELLRKMGEEGKLSPEMRKKMEELSGLQSEIQKALKELLSKNSGSALEGGEEISRSIGELLKDLQSYSVKPDTLVKSKKLEEKFLNAQKSIQSKGVSEKRKAEKAKEYEIKAPEENQEQALEKINLESIKYKNILEYYKRLIERYRKD
jgi:hypothetical protein